MRAWAHALTACALVLSASVGAAPACPPPPVQLSAQQSRAYADKAVDRGLLWRLRRDGRTSYLFGSLHVGKVDWAYPGPALQAAWRDTEALAVELDPADVGPVIAQRAPGEPLPAALAKRLAAQAQAACLPAGALAGWPPVLQLATLTLLDARRDGFDASFGQEAMLMARARAEGRPLLALESAEEQLDALEPGSPAETRALIDGGLRQLEQGAVRAPLRRLGQAWASGDLPALADYPRWCRCAETPAERVWLRRLNDERNPHLAERIAALHGAGQSLLAVVGALHMSGPQALPKLLAAQGFEVELLVGRATK
jgi:hypothetical protein